MTNEPQQHPELPYEAIESLTAGRALEAVYHLVDLSPRMKKSGEPFYCLSLGDATGRLNAVMWDELAPLQNRDVLEDDFVLVQGFIGEFNGKIQLTVSAIQSIDEKMIDLKRFLPFSPRPLEEMEAELEAAIESVENRDCRRLLDKMFGHPKFREMFLHAPAAAHIHQAYIHGLLDHTLNVLKHALHLAQMYKPVDHDILITATLLHDIGKVRELAWKRSITYTQEGRFIGHIPMGSMMVENAIRDLMKEEEGFDSRVRDHVLHLILSHHGKLEWGSPTLPKTREAMILHYADYMDAYMTIFDNETNEVAARGEKWTNYSKYFNAYLFAGTPLGEPPPIPENPSEPCYAENKTDVVMDDKSPTVR